MSQSDGTSAIADGYGMGTRKRAGTPCRHCHRPAEEHHAYEPLELPPGCKCDPATYNRWPVAICGEYKPRWDGRCGNCWHDRACHAKEGE